MIRFPRMNENRIVQEIADEVRRRFEDEGTGHDWWHIVRVWNAAKRIGEEEGAKLFVVELGALLHDIADWKFHGNDESAGPEAARQLLSAHGVSADVIGHVADIVSTISFKGGGVKTKMRTLEGKCVQDADRLDAMGAIGIARAFAYGGHKGRLMYHPDVKPVLHASKEEYMKSEGTTVNHFYEKLLLLKDRMNTAAAKRLAEERHRFMEDYLTRFFAECDGTQ